MIRLKKSTQCLKIQKRLEKRQKNTPKIRASATQKKKIFSEKQQFL